MQKRLPAALATIVLTLSLGAVALADRISVNEIPKESIRLQAADSAHPAVTVERAWRDSLGGHIFVHTALVVQGGSRDGQIAPGRLALVLKMSDGSTKYFGAMTSAAPNRVKVGITDAYEVPQVDPDSDLGAQGPLGVPAHATMKVTATFYIGLNPAIADPNATPAVVVLR